MDAASLERDADCCGVSLHGARSTDTLRLPGTHEARRDGANVAGRDGGSAATDVVAGSERNTGTLRRIARPAGTLHTASRLHSVWTDGSGLLYGARANRVRAAILSRL